MTAGLLRVSVSTSADPNGVETTLPGIQNFLLALKMAESLTGGSFSERLARIPV